VGEGGGGVDGIVGCRGGWGKEKKEWLRPRGRVAGEGRWWGGRVRGLGGGHDVGE